MGEETSSREGLSEVESCGQCRDLYASLNSTLNIMETGIELADPGPAYWQKFECQLADTLVEKTREQRPNSIFARILKSRITVPLPLAAGFVLAACAAIAGFALRQPANIYAVSRPQAAPKTIERIVEVPVEKERVVTRTVYVDRLVQAKAKRGPDAGSLSNPELVATAPESEGGTVTRADLAGFRPPDDFRMRVIKKREGDER